MFWYAWHVRIVWVILGLPCHYLSSQQLFISLSLWYNASLPPAYLWHPCAASVYRSSRLPLILNVFVALSLSLSNTLSISISNSLALSLPPSLSPLMNHLPLPLNSTESEGSSRVALISPTSHSRDTETTNCAPGCAPTHACMCFRASQTLVSVCFYQAQGNTKGRKSLWAQFVICMSYANGCVITWLFRFYTCTGTQKKRCTFLYTYAEYVHSAHKGIINHFTFFWPIKSRTGENAHGWIAGTCKTHERCIIILTCTEVINQ